MNYKEEYFKTIKKTKAKGIKTSKKVNEILKNTEQNPTTLGEKEIINARKKRTTHSCAFITINLHKKIDFVIDNNIINDIFTINNYKDVLKKVIKLDITHLLCEDTCLQNFTNINNLASFLSKNKIQLVIIKFKNINFDTNGNIRFLDFWNQNFYSLLKKVLNKPLADIALVEQRKDIEYKENIKNREGIKFENIFKNKNIYLGISLAPNTFATTFLLNFGKEINNYLNYYNFGNDTIKYNILFNLSKHNINYKTVSQKNNKNLSFNQKILLASHDKTNGMVKNIIFDNGFINYKNLQEINSKLIYENVTLEKFTLIFVFVPFCKKTKANQEYQRIIALFKKQKNVIIIEKKDYFDLSIQRGNLFYSYKNKYKLKRLIKKEQNVRTTNNKS